MARLSWRRDPIVFAGFLAVSVGYFVAPLYPHPGRVILGETGDSAIFVWAFAWWPHAILSGTNPIVTHVLYAPSGANLVWATSVPGLAVLFTPLTLLAGPVVSFNIAVVVLPALGGWTAYRLCLVLSGSLWGALVGGYLFGFSSFVLAQQSVAHVFLTADFLVPLVVLAVARLLRGEWSRRTFVLCFGALIALQFSISTEVAFSLTLMLVVSGLLATAFLTELRPRVRTLVPCILQGYCLAALLAAPLVVYAVVGFPRHGFVHDPEGTDLLDLVFPTGVNALLGGVFPTIQEHFNPHETAAFLGVPTLLIVALYLRRTRGSGWTRVLVSTLVVSVLFALGPELVVSGHRVGPLPWAALQGLPGFVEARTPRFGEYAALASALIVALWTAGGRGRSFRRPYLLPALAVAALVPAVWHPYPDLHPERPAFFTAGLYKSCIPKGETLAIFPFGAEANILQAESGFWFRVAGGYLVQAPLGHDSIVSFDNDPTVYELDVFPDRGVPTMDALLAFAERRRVGRIVSIVGSGYPSPAELRAFGPVERIGGVYVAPACGRPSLLTRPLPARAQLVLTEQQHGVSIDYCLGAYSYDLPAGLQPAAELKGATLSPYVSGVGLDCSPPAGDRRHGYAATTLGVPADTYPFYSG